MIDLDEILKPYCAEPRPEFYSDQIIFVSSANHNTLEAEELLEKENE